MYLGPALFPYSNYLSFDGCVFAGVDASNWINNEAILKGGFVFNISTYTGL
jgi:hypothetical protein